MGLTEYRHYHMQKTEMLANSSRRTKLVADVIKNSLIASMVDNEHDEFQSFLEPLVSDETLAVRLLKPDGMVIGSSNALEVGTIMSVSEPGVHKDMDGLKYQVYLPLYNERPCLMCHWGEPDVIAMLQVETSAGTALNNFNKVERKFFIASALALVILAASLGIMTELLVTKPIKGIIRTIQRAREGDLKARFITSLTDEIGTLAENLNAMLFDLNKTRDQLMKCHEADMQKAEKMASVGELAAAIAHDIKNPLAGISGALQVFAEDFPEDDPRKVIINETLQEITRLDRSVKDLLNYARPPEPHFIKTSIVHVIDRVVMLLSGQCRKQGIEIQVAPPRESIDIYVDPEQIQQVFLNIMLNAMQSMSEGGGQIKIETSFNSETGMAEVAFKDTGPGIPEPTLKDIFKPFFTTKYSGTGLGLAISKNTVERHGGTILANSRPGVGTTFRVLLPLEIKHG